MKLRDLIRMYVRKKDVIIIAVLIVIALVAVLGVQKYTAYSTRYTALAESLSIMTTTAEEKPIEVLELKTKITLDDFEITPKSIEYVDFIYISENYGYSPDSDKSVYAKISINLKNVGKKSNEFLPIYATGSEVRAKLIYDDELEYSLSRFASADDELHGKYLNPLETATGFIAASVPKYITKGSDSLVLCIYNDDSEVYFNLRESD